MEGLIKGLIDVVLGDHDGRNEDPAPQQRDERSRSSWAEVVSGEQDDDGIGRNEDGRRHHQTPWNRQEDQGESGHESSRPPKRTQAAVDEGNERYGGGEQHSYGRPQWNREEEDKEEKNDGWESVTKKPLRKPHKVQMDEWNGYKQPASEQKYADEVETRGSIEPTEEELSDLSQACNKLWELDSNRLVPGKDYEIDCGEGKKVYQRDDMAEGSLFSWLGDDVLRRPTISRFCSLLDNYNPHQGCREEVTSEEKQEQLAFVEEISRTAPIKYLHKYLAAKGGIVSHDYREFKMMLKGLWFDLYGRGGTSGCSSAFEHVFVGEIKQRGEQEVSGFHNWLQFYLEEAKGRVDYQGYIFPRRRGQTPDSETQLLTIQFEWNGVLKSVSSTLVGVSPEFEVALYTLCYFAGGEDNRIMLGPYPVNIKCYRLGDRIGSVFPISDC